MRAYLLTLFIASLTWGACNSSNSVTSNTMDSQLMLHDIWALEWMLGKDVDEIKFTRGVPTLEIFVVDGRVQGQNGCNQIHGPLAISQEALEFGPLVSTRMACKDDGFEQAFMTLLEKPLGYQVKEGKLILSQDGREVLRFKKVD